MAKTTRKTTLLLLFFLFFNFCNLSTSRVLGDDVKALESVAISLIIDKSGSMSDTDPSLMRETAANILVDLLSPEDYLGIISFSNDAQEIQPMALIGETGKDQLKGKITGNLEALGNTDYLKAFDLAFRQMESIQDENLNKVIIFLTDGDPDPDAARRDEPGFMEEYMDSFWLKVKEIGLAGYTVHTVGLGTLDSEVMDRLALETTGTSNVYSESSDVAVAFFDIISQLKNRNEFMNISEDVAGEKLLDFKMDEFVSQETFVVRNTGGPLEIDFIPPEGVDPGENLKIVKTESYTLATINQDEAESSGMWKIKLTGNASAEIMGTKDLFVKIWMDSPINNSLHPIGEPLEIRATLTGSSSEEFLVEGDVMINGVQALQPLTFVKEGDEYVGVFEDTSTRGDYEINLAVHSEEEVIAATSTTISVKLLPAIKSDLVLQETGYVQGEERIVSSTLTLASTNLKVSDELTLDYYELVQRNEEEEETIISLVDDGVFENGDVKAEDGIFSGILSFDALGEQEIFIRTRGTYNGDLFILEKNIGRAEVLPPGTVSISLESRSYELLQGDAAQLLLTMKSTSPYREVVNLSIDGAYGILETESVALEPMEEKTVNVSLMPAVEANGELLTVPVSFTVNNELTSLSSESVDLELMVTTNTARIISRIRENLMLITGILVSIAAALLLIYGIGRVLYEKNYKKLYQVAGRLTYRRTDDDASKETGNVDLSTFGKSKVILTFSEKRKDTSDYFIPGSRYDYDLIFEKMVDQGRFKFMDGYRSLNRKTPPKLQIKTTEPGILVVNDAILIKYEVDTQVNFTSGEYVFSYESAWVGDAKADTGKNILEGKF
ncbi:VWA domain-containing protein [Proteiniclasticum sp. SCR006]|uniref:VWA domain-containing protein n=1 Tax=Proteiniclasticum aestuarii TaxID=2817862 RepID=A0A939HB86_9CLOT|nr:vWA domain-containing protein [Proteiniclasticum aestuarii]MBO1265969.1 VWA domain-containing protein [Proteiniclasticum aestuarii]